MEQMLYLPAEIGLAFKQQFSFPQGYLFGSVATLSECHPRVRMMRIYDFNHDGCPVLLTHTRSNKWKDFVNHAHVSINIVSENKLMQIIVFGALQLDTSLSAPAKARHYWNMVRPDVKKIYDSGHAIEEVYCGMKDLTIPQEAPDTFGMVCITPSFWEILHLDSDYTKSCRYQYHFTNGTWQKQRFNVGLAAAR
jgi:pyridoxine/pyridoxamine 5'-phosphate oxidase